MDTEQLEKSIQEVWSLFKDTDRKFQDTDRKFLDTDRKLDKLDRVVESTSRDVANMSRTVEALTGKWGKFVEGLLAPGVVTLFAQRGIEVEQVFQRAKARHNGGQMEVDLLASNGEYVVAIEVKSTLSVGDVKDHLEKLQQFKQFFPQYQNHQLIGAVAGIVIEENADRFAYKAGLFVIGQSGETVKILNDSKFSPHTW